MDMAKAKQEVSEMTIPKVFQSAEVEQELIASWKDQKCFTPKKSTTGEKFSMLLPPPNVTGHLTLAHAIHIAIEDALVRYHRMKGDQTLYIPGTDHAGLSTEHQINLELVRNKKHPDRISSEDYLAFANNWVEQNRLAINKQIDQMGASCDWSKERYTLDEEYTKTLERLFVDLYRKGVIYYDDNIVNWCTKAKTVLSDLEVFEEEENTKLYHIRYFVKAADKSVVISTTRPETILGDVAVAVNPNDKRFKDFHDKVLILPIVNKEIPVIFDERVDMNEGTGAAKITPAHKEFAFEIARDHDLPILSVIGTDGKMNKNAGKYAGLDVEQARANIVEYLDNIGNLEKVENTTVKVKKCELMGSVVEPLVMKQWFVKTKELAKKVQEATQNEETMIIPERFEPELVTWLENSKDWCISRQLRFGHGIPAWYNKDEVHVGLRAPKGDEWVKDEQVLDSWFSSSFWPLIVMGWPENTTDFKRYFPISVLETSKDLLFFWVARMIMMSIVLTKEVPFTYIYLHGDVKDGEKRPISLKQSGFNLQTLQKKFGSDVVRLLTTVGNVPGVDVEITDSKAEEYKLFVNKLWNASRFIRMQGDVEGSYEDIEKKLKKSYKKLAFAEQWILSRLNAMVEEVTNSYEDFGFGHATEKLMEFTKHELCDWFIEISKLENSSYSHLILQYAVLTTLKLWHPVMPFVTEAIWKFFDQQDHHMLAVSTWPALNQEFMEEEKEKDFELLIQIVRTIKQVREDKNVDAGKEIPVYIYAEVKKDLVSSFTHVMKKLARLSEVKVYSRKPQVEKAFTTMVYPFELIFPLDEIIDVKREKAKLEIQIQDLEKIIRTLKAKLENPAFIENAPKEVVFVQQKRRKEAEIALNTLKVKYEELS